MAVSVTPLMCPFSERATVRSAVEMMLTVKSDEEERRTSDEGKKRRDRTVLRWRTGAGADGGALEEVLYTEIEPSRRPMANFD
jgi:hypothetical protein